MRHFTLFLVATILYNCGSTHYSAVQYEYQKQTILNASSSKNILTEKFYSYKIGLDSVMEKEIGIVEKTLTKKPIESTLGNWMCDAMMWYSIHKLKATPDFAITNYGGIRIQALEKGPLKLKKIFELMPFDNTLTIASLKGDVVISLLRSTTRGAGQPCSQELRYEISRDSAVSIIWIKNEVLDPSKTYKVLLTDYMMTGGDNLSMLKGLPNESYPDLLRNALLDYCKYLKENNLSVDRWKSQNTISLKSHCLKV
jgi:2',3'-cyclic-nucleotide 2'-phosphodiesterase (5'-nucleotidase family)